MQRYRLQKGGGRWRGGGSLEPLLERLHGERHAAEVRQVLTHRQVAIHLVCRTALLVDVDVLLGLGLHQLRLRLEELRVL
jgi:hypothetical protein